MRGKSTPPKSVCSAACNFFSFFLNSVFAISYRHSPTAWRDYWRASIFLPGQVVGVNSIFNSYS